MRFFSYLSATAAVVYAASTTNSSPSGWHFVQNGTSGLVALEATFVSPNLAVLFDNPENISALVNNGNPFWAALWNIESNTVKPLTTATNPFCATGGFLSNGTMVSVGGIDVSFIPQAPPDGTRAIRILEPCDDPNGTGCEIFEDPVNLHLANTRYYPSSARISDGSLMIVGGSRDEVTFYNFIPENTIEFFPPKDNGVPRPSEFLSRSGNANLFPRVLSLPDGTVFVLANNISMIYDIENNSETMLPPLPNGQRATNPFDGGVALLPLSPPNFEPEVLVCGGTTTSDEIPRENVTSQDPATDQCSRLLLTREGIKRGWQVEKMLEPRTLHYLILLPNGQVLITGGAQTGYAGIDSVAQPVENGSNSDHPAFTPSLYSPLAPAGRRISNEGMPTTNIARLYHSTASLTPEGNIFIAGSNPHNTSVTTGRFPSELRVEYLNPPFINTQRPQLQNLPKQVAFNRKFTVDVTIPSNLKAKSIQVALMDLGFSTHGFQASQRLVFMEAQLSSDRKTLTINSPPNNRIFPPGPGLIFLTVDNVTSQGIRVIVGNGATPPVADQGIRI